MRTVKSVDDLKRLALVKGASVSFGATRFNSTGERSAPQKRVESAAPAPAPAAPVVDMAPVAAALERMGEMFASALRDTRAEAVAPAPPAPTAPLLVVQEAPERPRSVRMERDENGLVEYLDIDGRKVEVTRDKKGLLEAVGALRVTRNSDGWIDSISLE